MSERKEKVVEILKALAFVLVGFFGGIAAASFIEGFRDGFDDARSDAPAAASGQDAADAAGGDS